MSSTKMHLKMSSANCPPCCLGDKGVNNMAGEIWLLLFDSQTGILTPGIEGRCDANFVVTGGIRGCRCVNRRYYRDDKVGIMTTLRFQCNIFADVKSRHTNAYTFILLLL